ncbi:MAG: DUF58 domain-containing protein [Synechococcales bacterium]|nr:DUF58 domain-containing protein [Synechococcales bacterium]
MSHTSLPRRSLSPNQLTTWLESRWVAPSYSGWLLGGLAIFFFAAATNTMAGWLYVISGVMLALLAIAAALPNRTLRGIQISRQPMAPVHAGEAIAVALSITNSTAAPKGGVQVSDRLPIVIAPPQSLVIEAIAPGETRHWRYYPTTQRRGIYHWRTVETRTGNPLGLFWCRRRHEIPATAVVYPALLPLNRCPLLDDLGQTSHVQMPSHTHAQQATEGVTRTLRPYRWGDSTRLIHWRTSARYGELRVRELEVITGGQEIIIALDTDAPWVAEQFEQAVVATASLYDYALRHQLQAAVWTAIAGFQQGRMAVFNQLATIGFGESGPHDRPTDQPIIWLTATAASLSALPTGSRWLLWPGERSAMAPASSQDTVGITIQSDQPLQPQLQSWNPVNPAVR